MCESSFLHSFGDSPGEDAALIPLSMSVSAAAVKGTHPSKLFGFCFDKKQFQFGVWLCFALGGCFVVMIGGVFSLKASPGSLLHTEVSNMREPCYLMPIVTITARQFLVSLLLDDWEAAVGRVCGTVL